MVRRLVLLHRSISTERRRCACNGGEQREQHSEEFHLDLFGQCIREEAEPIASPQSDAYPERVLGVSEGQLVMPFLSR